MVGNPGGDIILPQFNENDYPLTKALLDIYDTAVDWQKEVGGKYERRELFRFACQLREERLKAILLKVK